MPLAGTDDGQWERLWGTTWKEASLRNYSFCWGLLDTNSFGVASRAAPLCSAMGRLPDADFSYRMTLYVMCLSCFKPCRSCYRYAPGVPLGKGKFLKQIQLGNKGWPERLEKGGF